MPSHTRRDLGGNRSAFSLPAMLGGPFERDPDVLSLRWLGTANFEVTVGGRVFLLDCFYDRGPRMRPIGFGPEDVVRATEIFIGHPHYDHISDAATVAQRIGAKVVGHPIASQVVIKEGLDPKLTMGFRGLGEGDLVEFGDYRVRILHGFHLLADADKPDPVPNIGKLREAREFWEDDLGPLTPEEQAHKAAVEARGSMEKAVLEEATMCMIFEFGDFKLVYRDSAGPVSAEEQAYFDSIDGVDAAIVGFIGRPLMRRQLDERTMPLVETYKPKVLLAAHHDDLYPVFLDMATEPLKMAVSHVLPDTHVVTPVYLEPTRIHMPTGRVLAANER
ncbi:MAG TPA: MBL fold metallo-hydrolase [Tepidiformaceae bacterium]|nr:MBL fold metallo-hydrolase [Tepidiformaceae bacterium]